MNKNNNRKLRFPEAISHLINQNAVCPVCKEQFETKEKLSNHFLMVHLNKRYMGWFLKRKPKRLSTVVYGSANHRKFHVFVCSTCDYGTNSLFLLQVHVANCDRMQHITDDSTSNSRDSGSTTNDTTKKQKTVSQQMSLLEDSEDPDGLVVPNYTQMISQNLNSVDGLLPDAGQFTTDGCMWKPNGNISKDLFFFDIPYSTKESNNIEHKTGHFCRTCYKIFTSTEDFDHHFINSPKHGRCQSIIIFTRFPTNFPPTIGVKYRFPKCVRSDKNPRTTCTVCKASDFKTIEQFHQHLIKCGRQRFDRIKTENEEKVLEEKKLDDKRRKSTRNARNRRNRIKNKIEIQEEDFEMEF